MSDAQTPPIETFIKFAPPTWPGDALETQPSNFSLFVPMGSGLGNPMVMMPWDNIESAFSRASYYSFHPHTGNPYTGAPVTEAGGGVIYFDAECQRAEIDAMLRLMDVRRDIVNYAAFIQDADKPEERFLTQMRLISGHGLEFLFRIPDKPETRPLREQKLNIGDAIWKFIETFRGEYLEGRYDVRGSLGGDDDWAKERLAFGFMVENAYHGVYRIWTRSWLITK
jgi:hypothetical protein